MEKKIHTVLGLIPPKELGFTQCHEHLMLRKGESYRQNPVLWMDDVEASIKEAKAYRSLGGSALVEAQPVGCGRMSQGLEEIAGRTGVHIVASTGFHKMQFYSKGHWIRNTDRGRLEGLFVEELTRGMYVGTDFAFPLKNRRDTGLADSRAKVFQTGACAGIIKTALDGCGLEGRYRDLFQAAAAAQKETGAPMMVHIEPGSSPMELVSFLEKEKVDLGRVYFCHMDRACRDWEVFRRVLDSGVSLEFDTIGRFRYHSDEEELELIKKILAEGEDRLLLSLDTTRARLKSYCENAVGLTYILEHFWPMMRREGISEMQFGKIFVESPARILAW